MFENSNEIESGAVTENSKKFDGDGLEMKYLKETMKREVHRVIDLIGSDSVTHFGVLTKNELWSSPASDDVSSYRVRLGDFVHAFFSLLVFVIVVMLDPIMVSCYYPSFESTQKVLLMVLPSVVGDISSVVFVAYSNKHHGIEKFPSQTL
ncbi:hypothetical protein GIB67_041374 [Kingdonia uniflora]|uniref:Uncharacterized protein n=1 Tax=Kingdonia uniflora TaxID=39325 RepID=A0A7J7LRH3_9MAGN|nr:hypothetical protein GIB67_041374 [Kingdonia uniflora]